MAINPSLINFNSYKQYDPIPPSFLITHNQNLPDIIVPGLPYMLHDTPAWLTIYDENPNDFKIKLSGFASSLTPGQHSVAINLTFTPGPQYVYETLYVEITIIKTQLLQVTPGSANFDFVIGGSSPTARVFNILSEASWTIAKTAAWLILSTAAGSNNGSFNVSINTTGLAPGTYNDNVTVDDGGTPVVIPVSLTVTEADTGSDYLSVYPTVLNFGFTEGGTVPSPKLIFINASANYTVTTAQSWLLLSAASGSSGYSQFTIGLQNLGALAIGNHVGYVDVKIGSTLVKRITIYLEIYELISETLDPNTLYFCDDENMIKVSSGRNDTSMIMVISASYLGVNHNLPYNIPFFSGIAAKRIGEEAKNIMGDTNLFGLAEIGVLLPYNPVNLNFDINEIEISTNTVLQSSSLNGVRFLKGKKPLTSWLCNLPKKIYLTKKATLIFSVLSDGNAPGDLVISGDVAQTITTNAQVFDYYTVVLPFSKLGTIEAEFNFDVSLLGQSINVTIIDDNLDQSMLYAESQWGTLEPFEFTGQVVETSKFRDEKYEFRKDHLHTETKVHQRKKRKAFKINTGFIYTDEMMNYLDVLLEAEVYYLQTANSFQKVICTAKKLEVMNSLREFNSADLTFEDVIE